MIKLDLRKYGTNFTKEDIYTEIAAIGTSSSDITDVVIAPGATIPDHAFEQWENLELVHYLSTAVSIGDYAFAECRSLTNKSIGNCDHIGNNAFY